MMKDFEKFKSISMVEFVTTYLDMGELLNDGVINLLSKATHRDLKTLEIPYVKTVPYEIVTLEDVMEGNIILVHDGKSTERNRRIAPYRRPSIVKEEEERKMMREKKEILFRKEQGKVNFELVVGERQKTPMTLEVGFQEAALVLVYPDGGIDVMPFDGETDWHIDYYKKLFETSPRFATIIREFFSKIDWDDCNTIVLNRELSFRGVSALHNYSIHDMVRDKDFLKYTRADFYTFLAGNQSEEHKAVIKMMEDNYDISLLNEQIYNPRIKDFEDKRKGRNL